MHMDVLSISPFIALIGSVLGLLAYIYTTFATVKFVQDKHDEIKSLIDDLREWTKLVDQRLWEINQKLNK